MHSVSQKVLSASRTAVSHSETVHTRFTHRIPVSDPNEGVPDAVQNKYSVLSSAHKPDFELYCKETGPMDKTVKQLLLIALQLQLLFISMCPIEGFFWENDAGIRSLIISLSYFVGANIPNANGDLCLVLAAIVWCLFYLAIVYSAVLRYVFFERRHINKWMVYIRTYLESFVHVFLYPFHQGLNGYFLGHSFADEGYPIGAGFLVFMTTLVAFASNWWYLSEQHHHVKYTYLLFPVWDLKTVKILYCCLGVTNFLMYAVPYVGGNLTAVSFVCALLMGLYAFWELFGYQWMKKKDLMIMQSLSLFSAVSYFTIAVNCVYHNKGESHAFWGMSLALLVVLSLNNVILEARLRRINRILHDTESVRKISSSMTMLEYLRVGLMSGNKDVLNCTDALDIMNAFPFSYDIHFFYAVFTLGFSTCPAQAEALLSAIDSSLKYDRERSRAFVEMQYCVGPISVSHSDKYNKNLISLRNSFIHLIHTINKCYGIIFMEMTGTLPVHALEFRCAYIDVLFQMRKFVHRYPQSQDGEFFVDLLTCMFPTSSDLKEIRLWQNRRLGYYKSLIDMFPSILVGSIDNLSILRDLKPGYGPSAVKFDRTAMRDLKKNELCDKKTKIKAPSPLFTRLVTWHLLFLGAVLILSALISMTLIYRYDNLYAKHVSDANQMYQFSTRCYLFDAYFYPLILQSEAEEYKTFFDDPTLVSEMLDAIESVQKEVSCLSTGLCHDYSYMDATLEFSIDFFNNTIKEGTFEVASYAFGLYAMTFWQQQIYTNDSMAVYITSDEDDSIWPTANYCRDIMGTVVGDLLSALDSGAVSTNAFTPFMRLACGVTVAVIILLFALDILTSLWLAEKDFRQFLITLRQTAKSALSDIQAFFASMENTIQGKSTASVDKSRVKRSRPVHIFIVVILFYIVVLLIITVFFFLSGYCFSNTLYNSSKISMEITELFVNMTQFVSNYQEVLFHYSNTSAALPLAMEVMHTADYILTYLWTGSQTKVLETYTLCSSQDLIFNKNAAEENTESIITDFLSNACANIYLDGAKRENRIINYLTARSFYTTVLPQLVMLIKAADDPKQNGLDVVTRHYKAWFSLNVIWTLFLPILLVIGSVTIDISYIAIVWLVDRLPEGAVSTETLSWFNKKLKTRSHSHTNIEPETNQRLFDIFPEAVVVIDQSSSIISVNKSAVKYFSEEQEDLPGSKLFETLGVQLIEIGTGVDLRTIIDRYMFSGRTLVATHTITGKFDNRDITLALTIVPVLEDNEEIKTKGASVVALLLQDISYECSLRDELENISKLPEAIVKHVLPAQLLKPLMNHQRNISFDVGHCCACVVKICGMDLWAENSACDAVVARLGSVVSTFDSLLQKYETLTRIKMMGTRYCVAGGLFNQGIDPFVYVLETLRFNFDVLEMIKDMKLNGVTIDCRIGVCFSGPVVAGIVGLQLPFFDIFGPIVKTVQQLADTSELNRIHVNGDLYSIISRYPFSCRKLTDGTFMISLSDDL